MVHAMSEPEVEIVGAVLADGTTIPLTNTHAEPSSNFSVDAAELEPHINEIVAIYHSHPGGAEYPSISDGKGLAPVPAVILTPTAAILWWWTDRGFYYRIWDHTYGVE